MLRATIQRIKKDTDFRTKLVVCLSFIANVAYALFLLGVSLSYDSKWFFTLSIYYVLFSLSRIFIFTQMKPTKTQRAKLRTMLACGYFLLLINLAVSTMTFILLFGNRYVNHHEITVITLATYTFSALTVAIIGCIKYLKRKEFVFSCAKIFSLVSASVSFIPLTNTMLTVFGEETEALRKILFPILCVAVTCFIIACAVYMICKAYSHLKVLNDEEKRR